MELINKKNKGFTLIEILLFLGISATMLLVVSIFITFILQAGTKSQTVAEVEQQGLFAMQTITQVIRNSTSITSPTAGNSATSATFVVPTGALSPTIFDLSSGAIRIKEGAGTAVNLTNTEVTASALNFQNLSWTSTSGEVRISFTLTRNNPENKNEYDYSKTFYATAALRK